MIFIFFRMSGLWIVLAILASACTGAAIRSGSRTVTVYAAASLTDAFTEVGRAFERQHPGVSVAFNFGGSQNLTTQIEQGAAADVFASANMQEMERLTAEGLIAPGASRVFVRNRLIVILPADNPAGVSSLDGLANPGLKLVLAAEEVPAGRYARQILKQLNSVYGLDFDRRVLANLVSNEDNARQAVTKVQLGEADASIVYVTDAMATPELRLIDIPEEQNVVAAYPIAPLANPPNRDLAEEFIEYVVSREGQAILQSWGFTPGGP